ncbi:hypothetical protein V6N11_042937 [Hibiscus sabdariffa]|uniref:Terpene synthase metal-binding domain-containing protein n=1 Tax=Hibiscus sabdariffa TaxID=183260 RepID=A0ABR2QXT3_9ROSI
MHSPRVCRKNWHRVSLIGASLPCPKTIDTKGHSEIRGKVLLSLYEEDDSHDKTLLKFAKLDFNLLQSFHKEELSKISRWQKDLDIVNKLPFARDRLVESYFWILRVYFESQYSLAREILNKVLVMASNMNDIYDMKKLSQSYFVEAKWYHENYIPTIEEYMENGLVSSGYIMFAITSFIGMGDIVTETFNWASNNPKIISTALVIARLMDDIAPQTIECYMKQHGVLEAKECEKLNEHVENAWKDVNQELLTRPIVGAPLSVLTRVLNLTRVLDFLYKEGDGYTHVGSVVKNGITSLLIHPIPI